MTPTRHLARWLAPLLMLVGMAALAADDPVLRVAYAGSMGVVMDQSLGPAFARTHRAGYQGIGQGSYALARLLAGKQMQADVFVAITPGPMQVLQQAALVDHAVPVASTRMVVIYSPDSRYAADFAAAARGDKRWYDVLREPGLRLGRTDPSIDPQGANALLTLQLAERYYHQPHLLQQVAGALQNPRQIFAEPSLMSRLQAGQIDAAIGYASAAHSHHLPVIDLPAEIDLAQPAMQASWYSQAHLALADGKVIKAQPLVFYAAVPTNAKQPALGADFVRLLQSAEGQAMLRERGYGPPHGDAL
ncbi:extracellular solute-binding protein [Rhodanobacter sp. B2A1Ga4]|uniref:extracellular solute-binding protein n=1 Tax=Rhodanobacter sp. B2A1Ga4 TaxID=2778647 RepID=UPI001B3814A2|nr:extracellular solute-binding protein [Rhodanobacter sp. B2A1Ga4]MBQ4855858.1 extracellular solute-binding protein [Rhodanobacter sp. B2A1Ga4]